MLDNFSKSVWTDFTMDYLMCNFPFIYQRSRNSSSNGSSTGSPNTTPSHMSGDPLPVGTHISRHSTTPPPLLPRSLMPPTHSQQLLLMQQPVSGSPESAVPLPQVSPTASSQPNQGHDLESSRLYDKLPRVLPAPPIPSRAGQEGLYDIIPGHQQHYLHEKMAASERKKEQSRSTPPVSWTPQLPPRNSANKLKRTSSAEFTGNALKDQDKQVLVRHGSERRVSASGHESREHSESSSSSKRVRSASTERDRDRKIRRDRSSSEHHHHHHHSRSGERSSSEKHHSSSEKHHSSDKSSPASSKSKHGSESSFWKILSGPSSSKTKSSPSAPRSTKHSTSKVPEKEKERKRSEKEEKDRRKEKDKPSSSSRSRESKSVVMRPESSRSKTHHSTSQRKDEVHALVSRSP